MRRKKTAGRSLAAMRKRMLAWYARNKRAMPWRETRDAYRVWVSEVMLQQTRVAAVLPYYLRFVKRFPTVQSLARARSEDVLRHWAGLGYYSRARNLQRAAKEIVARHGGKFPRDVEAALALPGVGRYTAAAVLSMAYGEPLAVVDGNVARVLARWGGVRGDLRAGARWKKLEERAQQLMTSGEWRVASGEEIRQEEERKRGREEGKDSRGRSIRRADYASAFPSGSLRASGSEESAARGRDLSELKLRPPRSAKARRGALENRRQDGSNSLTTSAGGTRAGDWNQAMMELGATVCTPRAPRCGECPVARWCEARRLGIVETIPLARKKREAERVEIAAAVFVDARGRTLLVKPSRAETNGLFAGMWQFPIMKVASGEWRVASEKQMQIALEPQIHADNRRWRKRIEEGKGIGVKGKWVELDEVRHTVTFREVRVRPYLRRVEKLPATNGARVVSLERVAGMAVSSATKKIARVAEIKIRGEGLGARG